MTDSIGGAWDVPAYNDIQSSLTVGNCTLNTTTATNTIAWNRYPTYYYEVAENKTERAYNIAKKLVETKRVDCRTVAQFLALVQDILVVL